MSRPFDARFFDSGAFDTDLPVIRPTLGGWSEKIAPLSNWAPSDLARGSAWSSKAQGQSTW